MPLAQALLCARPLAPPTGSRGAARSRVSPRRPAVRSDAVPAPAAGGRKHPNSQWPTGVPPKMGEHLMASGRVAPPSLSTGCGTGAPHMFQYHAAQTPVNVEVHPSAAALGAAAVRLFCDVAGASIARKGGVVVALSGGSLPGLLSGLASAQLDWAKVHVFLADERCVAASDPECSMSALKAAFLSAVPIPAANVHGLNGSSDAQAEADAYQAALLALPAALLPRSGAGIPALDLVMLGVGPDGHTASLFPNRAALAVANRAVLAVTDSPKPPAARVSLSLPTLNAASVVAFFAAGAAKAEVVQRVLECQALPGALPAQLVRPAPPGELRWCLDAQAAAQLRTGDWANPNKWPRSEVPAAPKS